MKTRNWLFALMAVILISMTSCRQEVPYGNVGIKVYLHGGEKGVNSELKGVGRSTC